jgi:hypothetical protein
MPCHSPTNARVIFSLTRAVPSGAMEMVSLKSVTRQLRAWAGVASASSKNRNGASSRRFVYAPWNISWNFFLTAKPGLLWLLAVAELCSAGQPRAAVPTQTRTLPRPVRDRQLRLRRIASAGSRTSRPECWSGKIESWCSGHAPRRCSSGGRFESRPRFR